MKKNGKKMNETEGVFVDYYAYLNLNQLSECTIGMEMNKFIDVPHKLKQQNFI